jgi:hypothetical protein
MFVRHFVYVGIFFVCWLLPLLHRTLPMLRRSRVLLYLDACGVTSQVGCDTRRVWCTDVSGWSF